MKQWQIFTLTALMVLVIFSYLGSPVSTMEILTPVINTIGFIYIIYLLEKGTPH